MSGIEIIQWAVKRCDKEKVPPTDSAIVRMIRFHLIDVNDEQAVAEKLAGEQKRTCEHE